MSEPRIPEPRIDLPIPEVSKRGDDDMPDDIEAALENARSMQEMEAAYQRLADWMKKVRT